MSTNFLHSGWELLGVVAGLYNSPKDLEQVASDAAVWRAAIVPGTVAQSLGIRIDGPDSGAVNSVNSLDSLDSKDWWYRCRFSAPGDRGVEQYLRFEGLATLADVWLNGQLVLSTRNMFVPYSCRIDENLRPENELMIRFKSLDAELSVRRPRPKWKTALVSQQNLRWIRTTLLGRIPGWTPPIAPVGPWKSISIETHDRVHLEKLDLQSMVRDSVPWVEVSAKVVGQAQRGERVEAAVLHIGKDSFPLTITAGQDDSQAARISGAFSVPNAPLWWPHTHGEPSLQRCRIELKLKSSNVDIDCADVGFKSLSLNREEGKVEFRVNGIPVFCRGACWTINEFVSLVGTEQGLREALTSARNAGLNMIRVGGTMVYESEEFYRLCDELGILVWQDFMFANMDYPVGDPDFRAEIEKEARYQLSRLQKHASVSVYCGGSEVQQQAAMMGRPHEEWSNEFFDETLPKLCSELHTGTAYFPSTPCEGALPFHVSEGITHYYGVGAYRRPLHDVRSAKVKFTPECLGFSNVPERETIELLARDKGGSLPPPHDPRWKARVPRDSGAGWDFEDIRDHYTRELFGLDPIALRSADVERYYAISRVTTGEVMKTVFAEWRKPGSQCGGGLVWFFKDLWPGAGWGMIDSRNQPKAVLHYLRRAWAAKAVLITDEGLDGLRLNVVNESKDPLRAIVGFEAFNYGRVKIAQAERTIEVPARGAISLQSDEMLGYFADLAYAYRFGPPKHDVLRAYLKSVPTGEAASAAELISEDFHFPSGLSLPKQDHDRIQATAVPFGVGQVRMTLKSPCFLQSVHIKSRGYCGSDDYFHLAPEQEKTILFSPLDGAQIPFKAELEALNLRDSIIVRATQ
jgi:beta-mannosidase